MPGKPFVTVWAEGDSEEALTQRDLKERQPRQRRWLHGLWLLRPGWHGHDVADAVGAGRRSVERWIDWYRNEGEVDGVRAPPRGHGRPSRLAVAQQARFGDEIATGRFRTAAGIGAWIAGTFGVTYPPGRVTGVVGRLRCHPVDGDVSADLDATCTHVAAILARWDAYPERVCSAVRWHWILAAPEHLPAPATP